MKGDVVEVFFFEFAFLEVSFIYDAAPVVAVSSRDAPQLPGGDFLGPIGLL